MIIDYVLSNTLKEITFLIKDNTEYEKEYLEQLIFNKINEKHYISNLNNSRIFYVRVNQKRFGYNLYICIFLLNDEEDIVDWNFIIENIEKIFECKSIKI